MTRENPSNPIHNGGMDSPSLIHVVVGVTIQKLKTNKAAGDDGLPSFYSCSLIGTIVSSAVF